MLNWGSPLVDEYVFVRTNNIATTSVAKQFNPVYHSFSL
jgi:hypothetical protein